MLKRYCNRMGRTQFCAFVILLAVGASASFAHASEPDAIRSVLSRQQAHWNRGNIDGFMSGYWNSPNLRFVSGAKIVSGWAQTLARYKARYATRQQMGRLSFSDLDVTMLAPDVGLAVGHWHLVRKNDAPGGAFSLIFQKIAGNWVIILDHTS